MSTDPRKRRQAKARRRRRLRSWSRQRIRNFGRLIHEIHALEAMIPQLWAVSPSGKIAVSEVIFPDFFRLAKKCGVVREIDAYLDRLVRHFGTDTLSSRRLTTAHRSAFEARHGSGEQTT